MDKNGHGTLALAWLLLGLWLQMLWAGIALGSPCAGDCDANAVTSIGEIISCVNIALGTAERDSCASCDQTNDRMVTIDELVGAVDTARGDCAAKFVQPAPGVSQSTIEAVDAFRVLSFGYLRNFVAAAGSGAGGARCIQCALPGQVKGTPRCDPGPGGGSILEAVLDECRNGTTTRTGTVRLTLSDPDFCNTCQIQVGTTGVEELTQYSEVTEADGETTTIAVPGTLRTDFMVTGEGCLGHADRASTYNGALRLADSVRDSTFEYDDVTTSVNSALSGGEECTVETIQNGHTHVEDHARNRRFNQMARNLVLTETIDTLGNRTVNLDTPDGGSLEVDCFGGEVRLETSEPIVFPARESCADSGQLQVTFFEQGTVSAARFDLGALELDFDFDGTFSRDQRFERCDDPRLAECSVDLPLSQNSPSPAPTPTDTPGMIPSTTYTVVPTPTRTATPTVTVSPTLAPTLTDTPVPPPTSTRTITPTITPTGPTRTPTATRTIPPGEAESAAFSILNTIDPSAPRPGETPNPAFFAREAESRPFSVLNTTIPGF